MCKKYGKILSINGVLKQILLIKLMFSQVCDPIQNIFKA